MPSIELKSLTKKFGPAFTAVDAVDLNAADGEMITLLGPSGCGKTTTLRMVAGLEQATAGSIRIGERDVYNAERGIDVSPENRGLGMVFQSYAIWPHMTVAQNVAYPLRMRRVGAARQAELVDKILAMVGMAGSQDKPAVKLSGGQQQRVALARALVFDPELLLLDEPLSNLDAKLREHMRLELKFMQKRVGLTALYVTHDQEEALTLSDRIVVMNAGRIEQVGTPQQIYLSPASRFVADFIGKANLIDLVHPVERDGDEIGIELPGFEGTTRIGLPLASIAEPRRPGTEPETPCLFFRPDKVELLDAAAVASHGRALIPGRVREHSYVGEYDEYLVAIDGAETSLKVKSPATAEPRAVGAAVALGIAHRDISLFGVAR